MTPEQAHELLTQVTAALNLNRQQHVAVLKALEILDPRPKESKK